MIGQKEFHQLRKVNIGADILRQSDSIMVKSISRDLYGSQGTRGVKLKVLRAKKQGPAQKWGDTFVLFT